VFPVHSGGIHSTGQVRPPAVHAAASALPLTGRRVTESPRQELMARSSSPCTRSRRSTRVRRCYVRVSRGRQALPVPPSRVFPRRLRERHGKVGSGNALQSSIAPWQLPRLSPALDSSPTGNRVKGRIRTLRFHATRFTTCQPPVTLGTKLGSKRALSAPATLR